MKVLFGFPGWGWTMYGVASFRSGGMWFVGFSKQLQKTEPEETTAEVAQEIDERNVALWRCTKCGSIGTVGRCCGSDSREPTQLL